MILEIKNLNQSNISFSMDSGDFLLLFGPDDAGKTELIYQILGLRHFRQGEILFEGISVKKLHADARKVIRFVPDSVCMEEITASDYFAMLAKTYEEYEQEDVLDMCEYFGVDMDVKLTDMTYNENKLTMLIGAMVTAPKLLILDEPMNFLTQESTMKLLGFLKFLSSRGMAILITASEAKEVKDYCNRYIYFKDDAVAHSGDMKDFYGTQKAITVVGGEHSLIKNMLGAPIVQTKHRATYLYDKAMQSRTISEIVGLMGNADIEVENLTLEEMLDKNYTRWM